MLAADGRTISWSGSNSRVSSAFSGEHAEAINRKHAARTLKVKPRQKIDSRYLAIDFNFSDNAASIESSTDRTCMHTPSPGNL